MAVLSRTSKQTERKPKLVGNHWLLLGLVLAAYAAIAAVALTLLYEEYPSLVRVEREMMRGLGR